ncbi:hypothetical protein CIB84_015893, partial [Bambusicola thoracicus]
GRRGRAGQEGKGKAGRGKAGGEGKGRRRRRAEQEGRCCDCALLAARYQNELAGVDTELLAERFYYQALSVAPQIGMPFNQLGTLAGSKYYNVEATYYYLRCIQSEVSFEGASGNLKRLYDKAAKMYQQLKKCESRKLSPSKKR